MINKPQSGEVNPTPAPMDADLMPSSLFWANAEDNYNAARLIHEAKSQVTRYPGVLFNLICTSIELSLKGFLRAKGYKVQKMKNDYGHDLVKALRAARAEGIEQLCKIDSDFERNLILASEYNNDKEFEYLVAGLKRDFPNDSVLLLGAATLVDNLKQFCISNMNLHHRKPTAYDPYKERERKAQQKAQRKLS
jgi:hypothetical protein